MEDNITLETLARTVMDEYPSHAQHSQRLAASSRSARELTDLGEALISQFVDQARVDGMSWTEIGQHLGISKQAAQQRFTHAWAVKLTGLSLRLTKRAKSALSIGRDLALANDAATITASHIVAGALAAGDGLPQALDGLGVGLESVHQALGLLPSGKPADDSARDHVGFSDEALQLLADAAESAPRFVDVTHLLAAALRGEHSSVWTALGRLGVTTEIVESAIRQSETSGDHLSARSGEGDSGSPSSQ